MTAYIGDSVAACVGVGLSDVVAVVGGSGSSLGSIHAGGRSIGPSAGRRHHPSHPRSGGLCRRRSSWSPACRLHGGRSSSPSGQWWWAKAPGDGPVAWHGPGPPASCRAGRATAGPAVPGHDGQQQPQGRAAGKRSGSSCGTGTLPPSLWPAACSPIAAVNGSLCRSGIHDWPSPLAMTSAGWWGHRLSTPDPPPSRECRQRPSAPCCRLV